MSARRERQRRLRRRGGAARATILAICVVVAIVVIALLSLIGYVVSIADSAPDISSLKPQDPGRNSIVYAADGKRLGIIQNDVLRFTVPSSQIPVSMREATVAIEDERFYKHQGVDLEGIVRAAIRNLNSGRTVQGGSTLTMQLVRTLYIPGQARQRTLQRKIREAKLAEELENEHPGRAGKEWILTKYLNSVSYGTNGGQTAVGVQAAARAYFDKPASELTLAESALLAGLPQAPSAYNPFQEPGRALARRNVVLRKMAEQGYVTGAEASAAMAEPLGLQSNGYFRRKRESYFFDYVTDELIKQYGVKTVRGGGLRIQTTIDLDLQQKARAAIAHDLSFPGAPSSAIVTIDPSNGYILAMASSAKYANSEFNLAANAKRQPGSAFKVMALVTAVNRGIDPKTTYYTSRPLNFIDPKWGPIDVKTYGNTYLGSVSLFQATLHSDNTVYQQLALDIGPERVARTAHELGIKSPLQGYPAETLGGLSRCCSPLEMANAYATIASGGWRNKPKAITRVTFPDGKFDDLSKPRRHKAFSSGAMSEVTKVLEANIKGGTGTRANIGCPAGGKTGTTDKNRNAWFVGFTPKLTTSVWVGFPKANIPMPNLFHGGPVDGGTFPAEIWGIYMKAARRGFCGDFPAPDEPFKPQPFSGTYARSRSPGEATPKDKIPKPAKQHELPKPATPQPAPQTGGIDPEAYDPDLYDAPPEQAPPDQTPPPGGGTPP